MALCCAASTLASGSRARTASRSGGQRAMHISPCRTSVGWRLVVLVAAWLLVADRLWLTTGRWYSQWLPVLLAGVVFIGAVGLFGGWLLRCGCTPWTPWQRRALLTLMLFVFTIRLAGQL